MNPYDTADACKMLAHPEGHSVNDLIIARETLRSVHRS